MTSDGNGNGYTLTSTHSPRTRDWWASTGAAASWSTNLQPVVAVFSPRPGRSTREAKTRCRRSSAAHPAHRWCSGCDVAGEGDSLRSLSSGPAGHTFEAARWPCHTPTTHSARHSYRLFAWACDSFRPPQPFGSKRHVTDRQHPTGAYVLARHPRTSVALAAPPLTRAEVAPYPRNTTCIADCLLPSWSRSWPSSALSPRRRPPSALLKVKCKQTTGTAAVDPIVHHNESTAHVPRPPVLRQQQLARQRQLRQLRRPRRQGHQLPRAHRHRGLLDPHAALHHRTRQAIPSRRSPPTTSLHRSADPTRPGLAFPADTRLIGTTYSWTCGQYMSVRPVRVRPQLRGRGWLAGQDPHVAHRLPQLLGRVKPNHLTSAVGNTTDNTHYAYSTKKSGVVSCPAGSPRRWSRCASRCSSSTSGPVPTWSCPPTARSSPATRSAHGDFWNAWQQADFQRLGPGLREHRPGAELRPVGGARRGLGLSECRADSVTGMSAQRLGSQLARLLGGAATDERDAGCAAGAGTPPALLLRVLCRRLGCAGFLDLPRRLPGRPGHQLRAGARRRPGPGRDRLDVGALRGGPPPREGPARPGHRTRRCLVLALMLTSRDHDRGAAVEQAPRAAVEWTSAPARGTAAAAPARCAWTGHPGRPAGVRREGAVLDSRRFEQVAAGSVRPPEAAQT